MKNFKKGLVASAFDLFHVGHVRLLRDASEQCEEVIAAIHFDPSIERSAKNKPIQSLLERVEQVDACKYVTDVVCYETEEELLQLLQDEELGIDVRILGSDYEGKNFTGKELNMPVYYHKRNHNYSSSELRRRIYIEESKKYE